MMTPSRLIALFAVAALTLGACGREEPEIEDQPLEPAAEDLDIAEGVAPTEPMAEPAYYGVWAADADWCDIAPGSADPSPIAFTESEFVGYENRCRVGYAEEGTEGGWRLELVCMGEGVEYTDVVEVDVDGEMLRMRREGAEEAVFVRCEES